MTEEKIKQYLENQYGLIKRYKDKENMQILYNIIHTKHKFGLDSYKQSLYIDAKKFVQSYITSADNEDYGYDDIQLSKIQKIVLLLEKKQQLSLLHLVRRLFLMRGYDTDKLSHIITNTEITIAFSSHKFLRGILLWLGASFIRVLLVYLFYIIIVGIIILPAPAVWMGLFNVSMNEFCSCSFLNHIANTLALICGSDSFSPQIIPIGVGGIVVYSIGKVLFYLIIINFFIKKIEEYLTIK